AAGVQTAGEHHVVRGLRSATLGRVTRRARRARDRGPPLTRAQWPVGPASRAQHRSPVAVTERGAAGLLEAPARRAVRLRGRDAEGGMEREAVELPGRRPGARRAERGGERVLADLGRPPAVPVAPGHAL